MASRGHSPSTTRPAPIRRAIPRSSGTTDRRGELPQVDRLSADGAFPAGSPRIVADDLDRHVTAITDLELDIHLPGSARTSEWRVGRARSRVQPPYENAVVGTESDRYRAPARAVAEAASTPVHRARRDVVIGPRDAAVDHQGVGRESSVVDARALVEGKSRSLTGRSAPGDGKNETDEHHENRRQNGGRSSPHCRPLQASGRCCEHGEIPSLRLVDPGPRT